MHQEEDSKSLMDKDRRKEAIKVKLQRLDDSITRTRKDHEGKFSIVHKIMHCNYTYNLRVAENVTFSVTLIHVGQFNARLFILFLRHLRHSCYRSWKADENLLRKSIFFKPKEPWGNRTAAWWGKVQCVWSGVGLMDVLFKSIIKIDLLECSLMSCCL